MNEGLFDNDIFVKLSASGLMLETLDLLKIKKSYTLGSFSYQIKPKGSGKLAKQIKLLPEQIQKEIIAFSDQTTAIEQAQNHDFIERCTGEHKLDIGEVLLLEKAMRSDSPLLLTADKRFLKQISQIQWLIDMLNNSLNGRLVCFESILFLLIQEIGYDLVHKKVKPTKDKFNELKLVFGGAYDKSEINAKEALSYQLDELETAIGPLLYPHQ